MKVFLKRYCLPLTGLILLLLFLPLLFRIFTDSRYEDDIKRVEDTIQKMSLPELETSMLFACTSEKIDFPACIEKKYMPTYLFRRYLVMDATDMERLKYLNAFLISLKDHKLRVRHGDEIRYILKKAEKEEDSEVLDALAAFYSSFPAASMKNYTPDEKENIPKLICRQNANIFLLLMRLILIEYDIPYILEKFQRLPPQEQSQMLDLFRKINQDFLDLHRPSNYLMSLLPMLEKLKS